MANVVASNLADVDMPLCPPLTRAMSVGEALESAYALAEQQGP
jgi:tartrate dehydratase alpha subunit/fumarate hydratase class I-like protein